MRVKITETAFAELVEIHSYIARDNPVAARAVATRIEEVVDRIGEFPEIAAPVDISDIRIFPVMPFPYLIFYTVGRREVIIRNIRHAGRMRP